MSEDVLITIEVPFPWNEIDGYIEGYTRGLKTRRERIEHLEAKVEQLEDEKEELIQAFLMAIMTERPTITHITWPALPPPCQWPEYPSPLQNPPWNRPWASV